MIKATALFLSIALAVTSTVQAAPISFLPAPAFDLLSSISLNISPDIGTVRDAYLSPGRDKNAPLIIHIQDAHGQFDAQKNIEQMLAYLHKEASVRLAFVEGASTPLSSELFTIFPDRKLNYRIAENLARRAEFSGVELFLLGIDSNKKFSALGIEDANLYRENLNTFKKVYEQLPAARNYFEQIERALDQKIRATPNRRLRDFLRAFRKWESGPSHALEHFSVLLTREAKDALSIDLTDPGAQKEFPNLVRFSLLHKFQQKMNGADAEREHKQLINSLKTARVDSKLVDAFRHLSPSDARHTLERVFDALRDPSFSFLESPNFRVASALKIFQGELDAVELHREIRHLSDRIFVARATTDGEKEMVRLSSEMIFLRGLARLELTREDYEVYRMRRALLQPDIWSRRAGVLNDSNDVSEHFRNAEHFYETALRREHLFVEKTLTEMSTRGEKKAVLITGGFHSDGLTRRLREKKISYVVLEPAMKKIESRAKYVEALTGMRLRSPSKAESDTLSAIVKSIPFEGWQRTVRQMGGDPDRMLAKVRHAVREASLGREMLDRISDRSILSSLVGFGASKEKQAPLRKEEKHPVDRGRRKLILGALAAAGTAALGVGLFLRDDESLPTKPIDPAAPSGASVSPEPWERDWNVEPTLEDAKRVVGETVAWLKRMHYPHSEVLDGYVEGLEKEKTSAVWNEYIIGAKGFDANTGAITISLNPSVIASRMHEIDTLRSRELFIGWASSVVREAWGYQTLRRASLTSRGERPIKRGSITAEEIENRITRGIAREAIETFQQQALFRWGIKNNFYDLDRLKNIHSLYVDSKALHDRYESLRAVLLNSDAKAIDLVSGNLSQLFNLVRSDPSGPANIYRVFFELEMDRSRLDIKKLIQTYPLGVGTRIPREHFQNTAQYLWPRVKKILEENADLLPPGTDLGFGAAPEKSIVSLALNGAKKAWRFLDRFFTHQDFQTEWVPIVTPWHGTFNELFLELETEFLEDRFNQWAREGTYPRAFLTHIQKRLLPGRTAFQTAYRFRVWSHQQKENGMRRGVFQDLLPAVLTISALFFPADTLFTGLLYGDIELILRGTIALLFGLQASAQVNILSSRLFVHQFYDDYYVRLPFLSNRDEKGPVWVNEVDQTIREAFERWQASPETDTDPFHPVFTPSQRKILGEVLDELAKGMTYPFLHIERLKARFEPLIMFVSPEPIDFHSPAGKQALLDLMPSVQHIAERQLSISPDAERMQEKIVQHIRWRNPAALSLMLLSLISAPASGVHVLFPWMGIALLYAVDMVYTKYLMRQYNRSINRAVLHAINLRLSRIRMPFNMTGEEFRDFAADVIPQVLEEDRVEVELKTAHIQILIKKLKSHFNRLKLFFTVFFWSTLFLYMFNLSAANAGWPRLAGGFFRASIATGVTTLVVFVWLRYYVRGKGKELAAVKQALIEDPVGKKFESMPEDPTEEGEQKGSGFGAAGHLKGFDFVRHNVQYKVREMVEYANKHLSFYDPLPIPEIIFERDAEKFQRRERAREEAGDEGRIFVDVSALDETKSKTLKDLRNIERVFWQAAARWYDRKVAAFWDRYLLDPKTTGTRISKTNTGDEIEERFRALVRTPQTGRTLLMVGTAYGPMFNAAQVASIGVGQATAVDISDQALRHASAEFVEAENVTFRNDSAFFLQTIPDGSVDFMVLDRVWGEEMPVELVRLAFEQAARVLKPGGVVWVAPALKTPQKGVILTREAVVINARLEYAVEGTGLYIADRSDLFFSKPSTGFGAETPAEQKKIVDYSVERGMLGTPVALNYPNATVLPLIVPQRRLVRGQMQHQAIISKFYRPRDRFNVYVDASRNRWYAIRTRASNKKNRAPEREDSAPEWDVRVPQTPAFQHSQERQISAPDHETIEEAPQQTSDMEFLRSLNAEQLREISTGAPLTRDHLTFDYDRTSDTEGVWAYADKNRIKMPIFLMSLPSSARRMRQEERFSSQRAAGVLNEVMNMLTLLTRHPEWDFYWLGFDRRAHQFTVHDVRESKAAKRTVSIDQSAARFVGTRIADYFALERSGGLILLGEDGLHTQDELVQKFVNTLALIENDIGPELYFYVDRLDEQGKPTTPEDLARAILKDAHTRGLKWPEQLRLTVEFQAAQQAATLDVTSFEQLQVGKVKSVIIGETPLVFHEQVWRFVGMRITESLWIDLNRGFGSASFLARPLSALVPLRLLAGFAPAPASVAVSLANYEKRYGVSSRAREAVTEAAFGMVDPALTHLAVPAKAVSISSETFIERVSAPLLARPQIFLSDLAALRDVATADELLKTLPLGSVLTVFTDGKSGEEYARIFGTLTSKGIQIKRLDKAITREHIRTVFQTYDGRPVAYERRLFLSSAHAELLRDDLGVGNVLAFEFDPKLETFARDAAYLSVTARPDAGVLRTQVGDLPLSWEKFGNGHRVFLTPYFEKLAELLSDIRASEQVQQAA